jgi:F-type H+-transporting ATPase subunit O
LPNYGVAGKYALALYITTVRKNALELVEAELHCGAAETNLVFADFHKDPSVSKTVRVKAIVEIFKNIKFNDVMRNFLAVLAENGKLSRLPQIISTYTTSVGPLGKVLVVVTATLVRILVLHLTLSWLSLCKETSQALWSSYSQLGFKDGT